MPPNAHLEYLKLRGQQEEGTLFGDIIGFVSTLKFGDVGVFNRHALGISKYISSTRAGIIFERLSKLSGMDKFSEVFKILVENMHVNVDNRAKSYSIYLQPYKSSIFDNTIQQPTGSKYGMELTLKSKFTTEMMTDISSLFVPETSPMMLYSNGLVLM